MYRAKLTRIKEALMKACSHYTSKLVRNIDTENKM